MGMLSATAKELRAAQVAHALARAVQHHDVNAIDAARILKHELRRLNTNRSHKLEVRSHGAQASIEKYAPERPPPNGSDDALHADHVYPVQRQASSTRSRRWRDGYVSCAGWRWWSA